MSAGPGAAESRERAGARTGPGRSGQVPEWIRRLRPPVPPEVAELLVLPGEEDGGAATPSTEALGEGALAALERALARKRSREAAWDLLGADALLTLACEGALGDPHPEAVLDVLVRRVAGDPDPGKGARDRD